MSFNYPAVNPVFFPTSSMPLILASSGTFKHPRPGTKIYMMASAIGGGGGGGGRSTGHTTDPESSNFGGSGGGGGSGRLARPVFLELIADVVVTIGAGGTGGPNEPTCGAGTAGGTTTFSTISASGGSGGSGPGINTSQGAAGGAGGAGGGGGGGSIPQNGGALGGTGGNGLDGLAGSGGFAGGRCGFSKNSGFGWSISLPSTINTDPTNWKIFTGIPNSGGDQTGGLGGDMTVIFPWVMGRGRGGTGAGSLNTTTASETGYSGAVFLWQMSQSQTGVR